MERAFSGYLVEETVLKFVETLKALLQNKYFTFIAVNEAFGTRPEVRTNQLLRGRSTSPGSYQTYPIGSADNIGMSEAHTDYGFRTITICDSYGVASLSSGGSRETYFEFKPATIDSPDHVEITFKAGGGNTITWYIYPTGDYQPSAA